MRSDERTVKVGKMLFAIIAGMIILSACAKKPEEISAVDVGGGMYDRQSCQTLASERVKVSQELENTSAEQSSAAKNDFWGVFWIGLPVSSMGGNDNEAAVALAKGKLQAIDRRRSEMGCA